MANTPQAKKRIRRNERRAEINGARMSRIRTFVKKVEAALDGADKSAAAEALKAAQPVIDTMVTKGIIHANKAARHKRELNAKVKALAAK